MGKEDNGIQANWISLSGFGVQQIAQFARRGDGEATRSLYEGDYGCQEVDNFYNQHKIERMKI